MPIRLVDLDWSRSVQPIARHKLTLCVSFRKLLVPLGGSDFYGEQHLGVELVACRVMRVDGQKIGRGHNVVREFFLWEEHSNEIATQVIDKLLRSKE